MIVTSTVHSKGGHSMMKSVSLTHQHISITVLRKILGTDLRTRLVSRSRKREEEPSLAPPRPRPVPSIFTHTSWEWITLESISIDG